MLGGADNPNGELLSYIIGADRVSEARCQLILTQLVLAGLAKDNGGYGNKFRRCQ
ncbi:TPA: hypothetical protein O7L81_004364 [Escherichia coli]|nr:hypothetical protein [Escherichia coli]HDB9326330.1 hypothetical protein [Escherichia coli]HDB9406943.1 hypothetical protein [Escherichia coli]HDB9628826.1 hypothetical protein [Escherichia coli]